MASMPVPDPAPASIAQPTIVNVDATVPLAGVSIFIRGVGCTVTSFGFDQTQPALSGSSPRAFTRYTPGPGRVAARLKPDPPNWAPYPVATSPRHAPYAADPRTIAGWLSSALGYA